MSDTAPTPTKAPRSRAKKAAPAPAVEQPATITAFKGFGPDLKCRDFQYEIGATYQHGGPVVRCAAGGFHACTNAMDVWNYYSPLTSRFAEVEMSGAIDREKDSDSKIASGSITIKAELRLPEFIKAAVASIIALAKGNTATGDRGHAAATGDSGHAAATGYRGHAAATGYSGHAAATGYRGHAAATGDRGHAAATGDRGHAAATGYSGHAAATGYSGHAAATGYSGHAAATGDRGHAVATGKWGIAAAFGPGGVAKAGDDGWIVLALWGWVNGDLALKTVRTAKVGGPEGIKSGVAYRIDNAGEFEEARS